jgi:hypothetical protein
MYIFFWAFGEIKCHEKSIKHYVSETRTVLARSLFSWVRQATLTSTSGQQMCNHAKKKNTKGLRLAPVRALDPFDIRAYETHRWVVTRILQPKRGCAYASGLPTLAEGVDVGIRKASATNGDGNTP